MCQLPFIRIWVRRTRAWENRISTCLPIARTLSTVRPVIGVSSWMRVSAGKIDSKRTTGLPASARLRVRAARNIVSPSGMTARAPGDVRLAGSWRRHRPTPHMKSHRGGAEAGLDEERCEGMLWRWHPVDFADEQAEA